MSDPIPAIPEAAATGDVAALYTDIRDTLGVDVVNLIWRHLATIDGALPWAWSTLRPLYADGMVIAEATAYRNEIPLPALPPVPSEVFASLGLTPDDLKAIVNILTAYDQSNPMNLIALTALHAKLEGRAERNPGPEAPALTHMPPRIPLPRLLNLNDLAPETAALATRLNRFGTRRPGAVLASLYRHLAYWPPYLGFAWLQLAPLDRDDDGRLAAAIRGARTAALSRADRLLMRLDTSPPPPSADLAAAISAAVEPFVGDAISRMVVICSLLRRTTEGAASS